MSTSCGTACRALSSAALSRFFALASVSIVVLALAPGAHAQLRRGMTFTVLEQVPGYVRVGADGVTNPYAGDTTVDQYRSLLCVNVDQRPAPSSISFDFYNGWVRGSLQVTSPVQGSALTSRARADEICAQTFGFGNRMAEFHDGYYGPGFAYAGGWSFWGAGSITTGTRFWTAIDDQPANPWNSAGGTPQSVDDILATIDTRALSQVVRFGSDAEIAAFYTPIANQIGDYVLARYDEDLRGEIADNPEAAVVFGMLLYGKEHGIPSEAFDNPIDCSAAMYTVSRADPMHCFIAALHGIIGLSDIQHLYHDFVHGMSATTVLRAVKVMARRVAWGITIGIAIFEFVHCMDWI